MLILRIGLYLAVAAAAYVVWASYGAGFAIEVAMLRGLVAAMAIAFVAYLGELVVMTAPPRQRAQADPPHAEAPRADAEPDPSMEPVNLPAVRAERTAAADKRRAA